jgi:hypothetical protein
MTIDQALDIIDQATQPSARLTRQDYVLVEQALRLIRDALNPQEPTEPPAQ